MRFAVITTLLVACWVFICCAPDNHEPTKPSAVYPAGGAVDVFVDISLYWTASDQDGDALSYDVYFGTSATPPLFQENMQDAFVYPGALQYATAYYWKVDVKDEHGTTAEGDVWYFQTMPATGNYHQYYLATGSYSNIRGNYHDPDPERGGPWIALSAYGSEGADAQWQFQGFAKAEIETLVVGAYSYDNGWDVTGGEHYQLLNYEIMDWDFLFDSDKSEDWHFAQITGPSAKPYVNDTTSMVTIRIVSGYTDHTHIREVFCKQADLDTGFMGESSPGTTTIMGGVETE